LEEHRKTGIRAVQSTPLFSRSGKVVGMISTHWRKPHRPSERDLRLLDVLVRQAADLIDRKQVVGALRESEERFHLLNDELELRVAERTQELTESQEQLRALAAEFNLAEHRARTCLATELHDHLAQMLTYGLLRLGRAKKVAGVVQQCRDLIKDTEEALTKSLAYTRTLITDLSPPVLHEYGLAAALRWLAGRMQKYDLMVRIEAPESPGPSMAEDRAVLLFQSVRELLINIAKHAQTDRATVKLQCQNGVLRLEVQDEGLGFDPLDTALSVTTTTSSKFGLFSIRERMKALGGSFEMGSVKGKGTTVTLILPLATSTESKGVTEALL
jgi:signal transduction histidine kinase